MTTEPNTATDKQLNFINSLLTQREVPAHVTRTLNDVPLEMLSKQAASEIISALLDAPETSGTKAPAKDDNYGIPSADVLPTGRYAIDNADGELTFYRVWRGTRNPDYVKVYLLHGPDESEIPFGKGLVTITKAIAEDPAGAAIRYGHEIGACSVCAKRLTNRVSRALGIGPICGGHFYGEEFKAVVRGAREHIKAQGLDPDGNVEEYENVERYDIHTDAPKAILAEEHTQNSTWVERDESQPHPEMLWAQIKDMSRTMSDAELDSVIALLTREQEKREFAKREAAQERAAYEAEMQEEHDQGFLGR